MAQYSKEEYEKKIKSGELEPLVSCKQYGYPGEGVRHRFGGTCFMGKDAEKKATEEYQKYLHIQEFKERLNADVPYNRDGSLTGPEIARREEEAATAATEREAFFNELYNREE